MPQRRNRQQRRAGPYESTRISERQSHEKKVHVQSSQYDVFSTGAVDLSTVKTRTETYTPLRVGNNPTTWLVGEFDPGWAQLITYITFFVSVTKNNGEASENGNGYLMNNAAHTLICTIKMTLNNTVVSSEQDKYWIKSYLQTALNHTRSQKESYLTLQGWKEDVSGAFDNLNPTAGAGHNTSLAGMHNVYGNAQLFLVCAPLLDVFKTDRLLSPGTKIQIEVYYNTPQLAMMAADTNNATRPKFVIHEPKLHVGYKDPSDDIAARIMSRWKTETWKFPLTVTNFEQHAIPVGTVNTRYDNLFRGRILDELVFYFQNYAHGAGAYVQNAFKISREGVRALRVFVNGNEVDMDLNQLDGVNSRMPYARFFFESGSPVQKGAGLDITEEFLEDYYIYHLNLTPNKDAFNGVDGPELGGNLTMEITFEGATTDVIDLCLLGMFPGLMEIDYQWNVVLRR